MATTSSDGFPWPVGSFRFSAEGDKLKRPNRRQMGWAALVAARHDSTETSSVGINRVLFEDLNELTPWKVALSNWDSLDEGAAN